MTLPVAESLCLKASRMILLPLTSQDLLNLGQRKRSQTKWSLMKDEGWLLAQLGRPQFYLKPSCHRKTQRMGLKQEHPIGTFQGSSLGTRKGKGLCTQSVLASFCSGCHKRMHRQGGLNSRHVFPHGSRSHMEGLKSKIKVLAGLAFAEGSFPPDLQSFLVCPHLAFSLGVRGEKNLWCLLLFF